MEDTFSTVRWGFDRITSRSKSHILKEVTDNGNYVALCGVAVREKQTRTGCIEIENGDMGDGYCRRCSQISLTN